MLSYVADIYEHTIPLMELPDPDFLSRLESDLTEPIHVQGMKVIIRTPFPSNGLLGSTKLCEMPMRCG